MSVINMTLKMEKYSIVGWFSVNLAFEFAVIFGDEHSKERDGIVALNFHCKSNILREKCLEPEEICFVKFEIV